MRKKHVPIRRSQFALQQFLAWLASEGAEIGVPTNPYEVVRYKAYWRGTSKAATHIVYAKENGLLTFTQGSLGHYRAFLDGTPMEELPKFENVKNSSVVNPKTELSKGEKKRTAIAERDGEDCWFCGVALGTDRTIEHLVPKSKGGRDILENYALAHAKCNHVAANMSLVAKIALRSKMRGEVQDA